MRSIYLHGELGNRFGSEYQLDVANVAEALHALCTQLDGFRQYFSDHYYQIVRGEELINVDAAEHQVLSLGEINEIHLLPCAAGAKRGGLGKIILGVAAIGLSFVPGFQPLAGGLITASRVASFGTSLLLGGVSALLSPQPEQASGPAASVATNASSLFNQPTTPSEGMAIPVAYGRQLRVEGIAISQELRTA